MLVLSRKKGESIVINNDIRITVVEVRGDKVRIGIDAPKDIPVHRQEVYETILRNEGSGRFGPTRPQTLGSHADDEPGEDSVPSPEDQL